MHKKIIRKRDRQTGRTHQEPNTTGPNRKQTRESMKTSGVFGHQSKHRRDGFAGHTYCAAAQS